MRRVALAGFMHESATFSRVPTRLSDFRLLEGEALLDRCEEGVSELSGAWSALRAAGCEASPILHAGATPSGLVERPAYEEIERRIVDGLSAGPAVDGVMLALHGSTTVRGVDDAQGRLVRRVRKAVGRQVPIVATLDLHATPSQTVAENVDALVAYRTAPHRDAVETGRRAGEILLRLMAGEAGTMAMVRLPLLLPGEFGQTAREPMASLMRQAEAAETASGNIWAISILQGYPWADLPVLGVSVAAVAARSARAEAETAAQELAARFWQMRADLYRSVEVMAVGPALEEARSLAHAGRLVYLLDSGDNPTAGADTDDARMLAAIADAGLQAAVFGFVADAPAVKACRSAGIGGHVSMRVGGVPSGRPEASVAVEGAVAALGEHYEGGATARIQVGSVDLLVSERRMGVRTPEDLAALGLDPSGAERVFVLKSGYLFPALTDLIARTSGARSILLATPGASCLDLGQIPYRRLVRPVYPLDPDMAWTARP